MDLDVLGDVNSAHGLWSDEDELSAHSTACCLDHHPHTDVSIDVVHKHIAVIIFCQRVLIYHRKALNAHNSSRQRMGEPMASHRERRRQMVENDFSPPDNVLV